MPKYFGWNDLHKKLEGFLPFERLVFFKLEANDGVPKNNTHFFRHSKKGIVISLASPYHIHEL